MTPHSVALDDPRISKFIERTELPVLVDFWAEWCAPCRTMSPEFEAASAQMPQVRFVKIETDANPRASARYGIRSIPTLVLCHYGKEIARRMGAIRANDLLGWIQQQIGTD